MLGLWRSTPIKFFRRKYSSPPQTWNVLFFGSDNVSLPSLQRLHTSKDLVKKLEVVVTEKPGKSVKEGAEVKLTIPKLTLLGSQVLPRTPNTLP